jgi:hypothetical protein
MKGDYKGEERWRPVVQVDGKIRHIQERWNGRFWVDLGADKCSQQPWWTYTPNRDVEASIRELRRLSRKIRGIE